MAVNAILAEKYRLFFGGSDQTKAVGPAGGSLDEPARAGGAGKRGVGGRYACLLHSARETFSPSFRRKDRAFPKMNSLLGKEYAVNLLVNLLRKSSVAPLLLGLSFLMILGCSQQFRNPDLVLNYPDDSAPGALAWDGRDLVIGKGNFILNVTDITTEGFEGSYADFGCEGKFTFGREPFALPQKPMKICGLASEGQCCGKGFLWVLNSAKREILQYDGERNIRQIIPAPGKSPQGLAYDGKNLWLADGGSGKIYEVSTTDGSVLSAFKSPVEAPAGVAADCRGLWVIGRDSCTSVSQNCDTPRLIRIDPENGQVLDETSLPGALTRPTAITWADGVMWIADANLNRIFKISVD